MKTLTAVGAGCPAAGPAAGWRPSGGVWTGCGCPAPADIGIGAGCGAPAVG